VLIGRRALAVPRRHNASTLLSLGLPMLPAVAAITIADLANRTILLGASSATDVGYLGVALRFASVVGIVVGGFQLAWQPHAFALGTGPSALRRIALDAGRIIVIIGSLVALVAAASPELVVLVCGPSFEPAVPTVGVALVGALATGGYVVASMPSAIAGRTKDLGISGSIGAAVAVGANFVLAPMAGAIGTAGAIAIGQVAGAAVAWRLGAAHAALPVRPAALGIAALSAVVSLVCTLPTDVPLVLRAALVTGFVAVAWREGTARDIIRYVMRRRG